MHIYPGIVFISKLLKEDMDKYINIPPRYEQKKEPINPNDYVQCTTSAGTTLSVTRCKHTAQEIRCSNPGTINKGNGWFCREHSTRQ